MGLAAEAPSIVPGSVTPDDPLAEVIAHLGAALMQVDAADDPIIIGHVRAAHSLAVFAHRSAAKAEAAHV